MKLTFIGADHEVTGSCHLLQACGKSILIDCGMEQGKDTYINQDIPVDISEIDYVLLTHAHIDHTGLLPLHFAHGFRGQVYATDATADLCDIMLRDSAHIQMFEAEWKNRKGMRAGNEEVVPLYTMDDAVGALELFVPCDYEEKLEICPGIEVRFTDVGHLLGSACIEIWVEEDGTRKKLLFSGDVGNLNQPLIKDPKTVAEADYVILESTYGDRCHDATPDYVNELAGIIKETFRKGGNVVIPSFAVGRTQELLYFIRKIKEDRLVEGFGNFPVYVDSPLAIEATNIFSKNTRDCYDEEAMELVEKGINPIQFPGLKVSVSSEESKEINFEKTPKVIISASGMCEAGRIKHHLKHNLWRPECTILFVGFQAYGSLGRAILDGAERVKLFGEAIEVKASIKKMHGISGHADRDGLIHWLQGVETKPERVFIVHGEELVCDAFAELLKREYGYETTAPYSGSEYDLVENVCVKEGSQIRAEEKVITKRANDVFSRLLAAGKRLSTVIQHNEGGTNKELAKFADQINSLCNKWDR